MTETKVIEIKGLTKSYRSMFSKTSTPAIENINLTVCAGETWAIVGPNGAGKSTTLHCIMGLFRPDAGVIRIFGKKPQDPTSRQKVGFQSEVFNTYGFQTAREILSFYSRLQYPYVQNLDDRIDQILQKVGLDRVHDKRISSYSKGMNQRLGLAQSLIHNPELIIWDEPSSGLDPEGRKLVIDLLKESKQQKKTILFSTHVLSDIEQVCDHIAMINRGKILLADSLQELSIKYPGKTLEDIYMELIR
jgi:ABC-2 type transport system ATP-binding protein